MIKMILVDVTFAMPVTQEIRITVKLEELTIPLASSEMEDGVNTPVFLNVRCLSYQMRSPSSKVKISVVFFIKNY